MLRMKRKAFDKGVVDMLAIDFKWKVKQTVVAFKLRFPNMINPCGE